MERRRGRLVEVDETGWLVLVFVRKARIVLVGASQGNRYLLYPKEKKVVNINCIYFNHCTK